MSNTDRVYISNCRIGVVSKNRSYLNINSDLSVYNSIHTGICVLNNSCLNASRAKYPVAFNYDVQNAIYGTVISNNSSASIMAYIRDVYHGIVFTSNSTGEIFNTTMSAKPGISSNIFYSGLYVQDSDVMIREIDDVSGWSSTTGPSGYTGSTLFRVNGGNISVVSDEGLAYPGNADISIGPKGGSVSQIDSVYTYNNLNITSLTGNYYYYQKQI